MIISLVGGSECENVEDEKNFHSPGQCRDGWNEAEDEPERKPRNI